MTRGPEIPPAPPAAGDASSGSAPGSTSEVTSVRLAATSEVTSVRLAALRAAGVDRFDPPGYGFIVSLLSRAHALAGAGAGGAGARLEARAAARLDQLEAAFHSAHAEAEGHLRALADAGTEADGALITSLRRTLDGGELEAVGRASRRRLRQLQAGREKTAVPWLARLRGQAAARDVRLSEPLERDLAKLERDGDVVERQAKRRAQALGNALSTALFRESLVSARVELAVARAADNVPEDAGPYNAQVLSARALATAERLSPHYLRALVAGLQDLAAVASAFESAPVKPTRKKAPARPGRSDPGAVGHTVRKSRRSPADRVR